YVDVDHRTLHPFPTRRSSDLRTHQLRLRGRYGCRRRARRRVRTRARRPERAGGVSEKRYYMACLDLTGRSCLVVGGGSVGLEKTRGLIDCDAQVTVVAPEIAPDLRELPAELIERPFESRDLDD